VTRAARRWASLALALALCAPACGRTRPGGGPIVLVVVDTLRADHLPCQGYARPTAPNLCAFAQDGVRFARAYTVRTETTPAIASMLTGLYPHRHGVRRLYQLLPEPIETATERLRDAGWATGGFVSSFVMMRDFSGLEQGFAVYDDDVRLREANRDNYQRDAADTVDRALAWLARSGPHAFLFVHLIEPHGPYTPPEPHLSRFALPRGGAVPEHVPAYQQLPGLGTIDEYVGRYDGEIAAADVEIGRLVAALRRLGWYDAATVIVVADHGESFGEENSWLRHGSRVSDAEAQVPLILKPAAGAERPPAGSVVETPVSVLDVYPTLLAAAGLPSDRPGLAGQDLGDVARAGRRALPPPLTELEKDSRGLVFAARGEACSARWSLSWEQAGDAALFSADPQPRWPGVAELPRHAPPNAGGECTDALAAAISPLLEDRATFRLDVPVALRSDMSDQDNRRRFMADRQGETKPLSEQEREALRALGYLE
jgi:arylsulfatase A-like enzyme